MVGVKVGVLVAVAVGVEVLVGVDVEVLVDVAVGVAVLAVTIKFAVMESAALPVAVTTYVPLPFEVVGTTKVQPAGKLPLLDGVMQDAWDTVVEPDPGLVWMVNVMVSECAQP